MNCHKVLGLLIFAQVVALCCFVPTASADVLFVPSEYRTIQAAIDDAAPGDVVSVGTGTFKEALVLTEGITLLGSGRTRTVIDAEADAVAIEAAPGCRICGFSIEEGIIGIDCNGADGIIENNYIQSRYLGIRSQDASPQILNNTIEAVYMCIVTKGSGAPVVRNNELTGRYVGLWAENTSPFVHNNRIADFEHGIYTIGSNGYLLNNKVINSLYDGIVITSDSGCVVSNNAVVGHYERGVSVFDSSPYISNNILTQNRTGLFCHNASPVMSYNCVASNRESDYDGVAASATDVLSDPLLVGVGIVSSITGVDDDKLVCADAHWDADSLTGLDLIPNMEKMYLIYSGQDRTYKVISNTRTSITVEVTVDVEPDDGAYKTLIWRGRLDQYVPGESEDYTQPGDAFFVSDVALQTTAAGWPANSPCISAGDPDPTFNDPDGTRNDLGIYGGAHGGQAGPLKAPLISLRSLEQVYETDEVVNILADVTNDQHQAIDVDLHIIFFIDGSPTFYSYPNWTTDFDPVPYSLSAGHDEMIAVLVIPAAAIPLADFKALAAFTKRGSFEIISSISELWFSVSDN